MVIFSFNKCTFIIFLKSFFPIRLEELLGGKWEVVLLQHNNKTKNIKSIFSELPTMHVAPVDTFLWKNLDTYNWAFWLFLSVVQSPRDPVSLFLLSSPFYLRVVVSSKKVQLMATRTMYVMIVKRSDPYGEHTALKKNTSLDECSFYYGFDTSLYTKQVDCKGAFPVYLNSFSRLLCFREKKRI